MRLGDLDSLMERLVKKQSGPANKRYTEGFNDALMKFRSMVSTEKTVEAVPVVRGEWLEPIWDSDWHSMTATCSHCRKRGEVRFKRNLQNVLIIDSPRCPECGAFMEGRGGGTP